MINMQIVACCALLHCSSVVAAILTRLMPREYEHMVDYYNKDGVLLFSQGIPVNKCVYNKKPDE
jgi:hypothetical protein